MKQFVKALPIEGNCFILAFPGLFNWKNQGRCVWWSTDLAAHQRRTFLRNNVI